jgi:hypothetical protein
MPISGLTHVLLLPTVRRKEGWQLYDIAAAVTRPLTALAPTENGPIIASPCGRFVAALEPEQVVIYSLDATLHSASVIAASAGSAAAAASAPSLAPIVFATIARRGVQGCAFSPRGTFLVTYELPVKGRAALQNMLVWHVETQQVRLRLQQKDWLPGTYGAPVQWNGDESRVAHQRGGVVVFYDGQLPLVAPEPVASAAATVSASAAASDAADSDASASASASAAAEDEDDAGSAVGGNRPTAKLYVPNLVQFSLAPAAASNLVATFAKGVKGAPSTMKLWHYPQFGGPEAAKVSKSIFAAERLELKWNTLCTHLLMMCHTDIDATGARYVFRTCGLAF